MLVLAKVAMYVIPHLRLMAQRRQLTEQMVYDYIICMYDIIARYGRNLLENMPPLPNDLDDRFKSMYVRFIMYCAENKELSKLIRNHKDYIIRCVKCDENQLSKLREKARECKLPAAVSDLIRVFS